jgi:hypothetical protein
MIVFDIELKIKWEHNFIESKMKKKTSKFNSWQIKCLKTKLKKKT